MTIRLRPHHLLCLLTFLGKGYTRAFVVTCARTVERLNAGEAALLVEGPDDLCAPMLTEAACHCHNDSVSARDQSALADAGQVLGQELKVGDFVDLDEDRVALLRRAFAAGEIRTACKGCEWQALCTQIAASGFSGCGLAPGARPGANATA